MFEVQLCGNGWAYACKYYWAEASNDRRRRRRSGPDSRMHERYVGASTLGKGIDFADEAAYSEHRRMSKRILVVEDQEDLRGVLRDLLGSSGYSVLEAVDGRDGVAKALSERPDLILMDIQLPVLDGYDATRQIKADPNLKATPVIAVSSFAMKGDEEKARAAGCDHYVTKPYSPMQLLRIIRGYLPEQG